MDSLVLTYSFIHPFCIFPEHYDLTQIISNQVGRSVQVAQLKKTFMIVPWLHCQDFMRANYIEKYRVSQIVDFVGLRSGHFCDLTIIKQW